MEALRGSRKVDGSPRCLRTLGGSLLLAVTLVGVGSVPQASSQSDKSTPPFADYQGDPSSNAQPVDGPDTQLSDVVGELDSLSMSGGGSLLAAAPDAGAVIESIPASTSPSSGTGKVTAWNHGSGANNNVWCRVKPQSLSSSGSSGSGTFMYGQAGKSINGYPYRSAGQASGLYQATETQAAANGLGITPQTYTAYGRSEYQVELDNFPYGSYVRSYINPIFRSQGTTISRVAVTPYPPATSAAEVGFSISTSIGLAGEPSWQRLYGSSFRNDSGTSRYSPVWYTNGLPPGTAFGRQMSISGNNIYSYIVKSFSTSRAEPIWGAAASARSDFGSLVEDAPFELSPYTNGLKVNAVTITKAAEDFVTMNMTLPAGWTALCP